MSVVTKQYAFWSEDNNDTWTTYGREVRTLRRTSDRKKLCEVSFLLNHRARYEPDVIAAREQALVDLAALKPHRDRAVPRHESHYVHGTKVRPAIKRPWKVRIYYVSMADERCYGEFTVTESEARAVKNAWQPNSQRWDAITQTWDRGGATQCPDIWAVKRPLLTCPGCWRARSNTFKTRERKAISDACAMCKGTAKVPELIPSPHPDWRRVDFPSEYTAPEQGDVVDDGAREDFDAHTFLSEGETAVL